MQELTKAEFTRLIDDADEVQDHISLVVNTADEARQIDVIRAIHDNNDHYLVEIRAIESQASVEDARDEFYEANKSNAYESIYFDSYHHELSNFVWDQMQQTGLLL